MSKETYSMEEVAEKIGVTRPTIQAEMNKGRLKSIKIGSRRLITKDQYADWLELMKKENAEEYEDTK